MFGHCAASPRSDAWTPTYHNAVVVVVVVAVKLLALGEAVGAEVDVVADGAADADNVRQVHVARIALVPQAGAGQRRCGAPRDQGERMTGTLTAWVADVVRGGAPRRTCAGERRDGHGGGAPLATGARQRRANEKPAEARAVHVVLSVCLLSTLPGPASTRPTSSSSSPRVLLVVLLVRFNGPLFPGPPVCLSGCRRRPPPSPRPPPPCRPRRPLCPLRRRRSLQLPLYRLPLHQLPLHQLPHQRGAPHGFAEVDVIAGATARRETALGEARTTTRPVEGRRRGTGTHRRFRRRRGRPGEGRSLEG